MQGPRYTPPPLVTGIYPYLDFLEEGAAPSWLEGRVFYDAVNKTLAVYNDESDVTLQLGQEIYIRAKNVTGDTLLNGTLIYISGASSGNPTIDKARSDSPNTTGVIAITSRWAFVRPLDQ
jgi:hypothetical protein